MRPSCPCGFPSRSRDGIQKGWIRWITFCFEVDSGVALITVNDPDRRNAVTDEISAGLRLAVNNAQIDPNVHAVVVTGAGKAFCAGADLSALGAAAEDGLRRLYDGFLAVADCTLPTVAAVNGPAVGAGLNLALACDVRIAGPAALFDARFQKLGIHPGGGMTWMLQRAVGPQVARAALLFGMRFDADAAVSHGLALEVADDPVAAARELAAGPASAPAGSRDRDEVHHAGHQQPGQRRHRIARDRHARRVGATGRVDPGTGLRGAAGHGAPQVIVYYLAIGTWLPARNWVQSSIMVCSTSGCSSGSMIAGARSLGAM